MVDFSSITGGFGSGSGFGMPSFLTVGFITWALYFVILFGGIWIACRLFFAPYKFIIVRKVGKGNTLCWRGTDWGFVDKKNNQNVKWFRRKKVATPIPLPSQIIPKNRWQSIVFVVELSPTQFIPLEYSDSVGLLEPTDQDLTVWARQKDKFLVDERDKDKEGILGRYPAIFSFALWAVVGLLIIASSAKYSGDMMKTAETNSANLMRDANNQAAMAAGQIASALGGVRQANINQQPVQNSPPPK